MRRSVLQAGAWTALGLAAAFAVVSANSSHRRAATTAAPATKATVASASSEKCSTNDVCCARDAKVAPAAFAATTPRAAKPKAIAKTVAGLTGAQGMVVGIDPESGQLGMPTPEQLQELRTLNAAQGISPPRVFEPINLPGGGIAVQADGLYLDYATLHLGANGKRIFGCQDRPADITTQPAPPALEEK